MTASPLPTVAAPAPYRSIVVGTDFSPCSAVALSQALRIATWSHASLHAVHVIDTTVVMEPGASLSEFQQAVRASLTDAALSAWRDFAAGIPGAAEITVEITPNNRVAGVLEHARGTRADLLVLGAFGARRPDVGFGTLATACVRTSLTDVLLVRDTQRGPFRAVVAGIDFSAASLKALYRAAAIATHEGAELHALHLLEAPWHRLGYPALEPKWLTENQQAYRQRAERMLADFTRPVVTANPGLRLRVVCEDSGTHRHGIADYATKAGADLTVLGTRGRTNLRDILLGSTAERVLAESSCSVLAVTAADSPEPRAAGR